MNPSSSQRRPTHRVAHSENWSSTAPSSSRFTSSAPGANANYVARVGSLVIRPLPKPPVRPLPRPSSVRPLPTPPRRPPRPPTLYLPEDDDGATKSNHAQSAAVQSASVPSTSVQNASSQSTSFAAAPAHTAHRPSLPIIAPLKIATPVRPLGLGLRLNASASPSQSPPSPQANHQERKHRRQGVDFHSHAEFSEILGLSDDGLDDLHEVSEPDEEDVFTDEDSLFGEVENLLAEGSDMQSPSSMQDLTAAFPPPPSLDSLLETPPPDLPLPLTPPELDSLYRSGQLHSFHHEYGDVSMNAGDPNESMARLEMSLAKLDSYRSSPDQDYSRDSHDYDDESVYSATDEGEQLVSEDEFGNLSGDGELRVRIQDDSGEADVSSRQLESVIRSITTPTFPRTQSIPKESAKPAPAIPVVVKTSTSFSLLPTFDFERPRVPPPLPKDTPPLPTSFSTTHLSVSVPVHSFAARNSSAPRLSPPRPDPKPKHGTSSTSERPSPSRRKSKNVPFLLRSVRSPRSASPPPPVPPRTPAHAALAHKALQPVSAPVQGSFMNMNLSPEEERQRTVVDRLRSLGPKCAALGKSTGASLKKQKSARWLRGSLHI